MTVSGRSAMFAAGHGCFCFFFQAEDGIRDYKVTGVQTCALPIFSGFFWLIAQTVGSKLVTMIGQVVLARLLLPDDFGLVGLAYTVTGFAVLIQQAGLREILINRHVHFNRWANPAFWMSLTLGCLGAALMVILAPVAAWMYDDWRLFYLVL